MNKMIELIWDCAEPREIPGVGMFNKGDKFIMDMSKGNSLIKQKLAIPANVVKPVKKEAAT